MNATPKLATFAEFSLPVLADRYRRSQDLPFSSPDRAVAAFEYVAALESALSVRGAA